MGLDCHSIHVRYTVLCRHKAVIFLQITLNRHPTDRPWGRGMGCMLWVWILTYILLLSLQCRIQYHDKIDRVITALDSSRNHAHHWYLENEAICIHNEHKDVLTHWGRDKMAAIFQTTISTPFSWMKKFELRLKFHWNLFLRVQLTMFQHWFR